MSYLILGIAVTVGLILLARGAARSGRQLLLRTLKWTGAIVALAVAVYLTVSGRIGIATMMAAGLIPIVLRARQIARLAQSFRGPTPGQSSDVETAYLRMRLDHNSGTLHGTVLEGAFRGKHLDELRLDNLMALLQECRINDAQSAAVLESYLDRVHGAEWRAGEDAGAGQRGAGVGAENSGSKWGSGGGGFRASQTMSVDEAYKVLGLGPGASPDEVRDAHRQLMLKIHPDHGGSTYLAAKINQAKELLLGG